MSRTLTASDRKALLGKPMKEWSDEELRYALDAGRWGDMMSVAIARGAKAELERRKALKKPMSRQMAASDRKALIRLASTLEKGSEERRAILSRLKMGLDFKSIDQEMVGAATEMGSLLYGRPDVAAKIRDALAGIGPYKKSARALFDAYQKAQGELDFEYSLYDD